MTWGAVGVAAIGVVGSQLANDGGSQTQTREMDPRLARYYFGDDGNGGLLGDASKLYQQQSAQGGLNPNQRAGLEYTRQVLTSPGYSQGYDAMRQAGLGLLGAGAAPSLFSGASNGGIPQLLSNARSGGLSSGLLGPTSMLGASNQQYTPISFDQNPTLSAMYGAIPATTTPAAAPAQTQAQNTLSPDQQQLFDYLARLRQGQWDAENSGGM